MTVRERAQRETARSGERIRMTLTPRADERARERSGPPASERERAVTLLPPASHCERPLSLARPAPARESPVTLVLPAKSDQAETLVPASSDRSPPIRRRSAPWTLANEFVHDGFSYRVLRRPVAADERGPLLTTREEEALFHAYRGFSNKRIAQCLDVSPSTVGVLLFRAAAKLGVKTRRDLLSAYERMKSGRTR